MIHKRVKLSAEKKRKIALELKRFIKKDSAILTSPSECYSYSGSGMVFPKAMPDFVVLPETVEEIRAILQIARKYLLPVTPVASSTQEPGIYPWFGGIVIDLMGMDKILEIDVERGYALIEPGVRIGKFSDELQKLNMRCTVGSFPPNISVLGNYTQAAVNSHRSSGILDDIQGVEVILPDGSIMRTGSAAYSSSIPNMSWHSWTNSFPDLKGLFINSAGTLGIITKAAIRIYDRNEGWIMPLAGFDTYQKTLLYMKRLTRANICQHICAWHWALYTIIDHLERYGHGAPSEVLVNVPWETPDERPYNLVVPSISGPKELLEGAQKAIERIVKECGGYICSDYIKEKFPGAYKFFAEHYGMHIPTNTFMGAYGEGFPMMGITFTDPKRAPELERFGLKYFRESIHKVGLSYYSHSVDLNRAMFLRFTPFVVAESTKREREKAAKIRGKYMEIAMKKYGGVPIRPPYEEKWGKTLNLTGAYGRTLRRIKKAIDPLNIMNSGYSMMMYGKELTKQE